MTSSNSFDFSLLPTLESRPAWRTLPSELDNLSDFPETMSRLVGCREFACVSMQDEPNLNGIPRESYFRAALAEYASMTDMAGEEANVNWHSSLNPLVHFVCLLRHVNIHVTSSKLDAATVSATWGDKPLDVDIWTVDTASLDAACKTQNAVHYSPSDLQEIKSWFEQAQHEWGAADLIRRAAEAFASEVLNSSP